MTPSTTMEVPPMFKGRSEKCLEAHPNAIDSHLFGERLYVVLPEGDGRCKVLRYDLTIEPCTPITIILRCRSLDIAKMCIMAEIASSPPSRATG